MQAKLMSLSQATDLIQDGMLLAIGGNAMHRTPTLFTLALTKKPVKNLTLVGAAPGLATDILLASGQADASYFGFSGLENEAGLSPGMRKGMEGDGHVKAIEGS
jgi:glutaconate CoA-transferase subunit A